MKAEPTLTAKDALLTFGTAALAAIIGVTIFSTIAYLFQRDGRPFERLVAAERACAHLNYQSERQACMNAQLAASQTGTVARK